MLPLGPNGYGEYLQPGRVTDCYLGILLDQPLAEIAPEIAVVRSEGVRELLRDETPASTTSSRSESSIIGSIPNARCWTCKPIRKRKSGFAGLLQSPLTDSNRRPPPYHRSNRQPDATHGNGFRLFPPVRAGAICDRLPPVAATGLHKGSIVSCPI